MRHQHWPTRDEGCDQSIRQKPRDADSYYKRSAEYKAKGNLDRAITDYNKVIEINPKIAVAYFNRGCVQQG